MRASSVLSKRLGSPYVSGRSRHWIKSKNPAAPAVKREAEEDWPRERPRGKRQLLTKEAVIT
jgi:hypothetical protein